ncbi:MAG: DUF5011 domain-containing protein [Chitinivibrionales bacterium]|nr:DUF5011 domain-containing protein [Chitinivibrionales bacterium]
MRFFIRAIMLLPFCFFFCTMLDEEMEWDNLKDPNGKKYFPPRITYVRDTVVAINNIVKLRAYATDINGTIIGFLWSFDHGDHWSRLSDKTGILVKQFTRQEIGKNCIHVKAVDNDSLVSAPDSFSVDVRLFPPSLQHVRDTMVSQFDSVTITVTVTDTTYGSSFLKYYWDMYADGWDDSTTLPAYTFKKSPGGMMPVVWGARDDDGSLSKDSFRIRFNRKPSEVSMVKPKNGTTALFDAFDKKKLTGSVLMQFRGVDIDLSTDTLTYTLSIGKTATALAIRYIGRDSTYLAAGLDTITKYFWRLKASDLYGDSVFTTGFFTTAPIDLTAPQITLNGSNPLVLTLATVYREPGAKAFDLVDGDCTSRIVIGGDIVNTSIAGTYSVSYTVSDKMGNTSTEKRTVIVKSCIVVETFDDSIVPLTTFGSRFSTSLVDSIGFWRAWTDALEGGTSRFEPNPYSNPTVPFQSVIGQGNGVDSSSGLSVIAYVGQEVMPLRWAMGLYLKNKTKYYNLSGIDSIVLYAKGDDWVGSIRVQFTNPSIDTLPFKKRWGYVGAPITIDLQWRRFCILPKDCQGLAETAAEGLTWDSVKTTINMIQFVNPPTEAYDQKIALDSIMLFGTFTNSGLLP